jgi:two-component system, OmpR family, response regulator
MRILLAEDEPVLCDQIKKLLSAEGRVVDVAHDGEEACFLGSTEPYDMIILDIGLPIRDGTSVLKEWRRSGIATPVLILTARDGWSDQTVSPARACGACPCNASAQLWADQPAVRKGWRGL